MKTEFKKDDIVTFKPYEKAIKAKVVEIVPTNKVSFVKDDDRIFYKLTGIDEPLTSTTTGGSIVESKLYKIEEKTWHATFTGREKGAIGIFYTITTTVKGNLKEDAHFALYDRYEHIHGLKLKEA